MKAAIKYCGSCNPQIDLVQIAKEFCGLAESRGVDFVNFSAIQIDLVVILNGCPIACADRLDVQEKASRCMVVTPQLVNSNSIGNQGILHAMKLTLENEFLEKSKPDDLYE